MKGKVIKTTDNKFLGKIYEVEDLDIDKIKEETGGKFSFDSIEIAPPNIILQNSNYTAMLLIINK